MIFLLISPGMVSAQWFPLSENAMSTFLLTGALALGSAVYSVGQAYAVVGPVKDCDKEYSLDSRLVCI